MIFQIHPNKKGAIELSIGTIVIIVLAMSMLILGLVLVKSIFTGAKYNVDQINDNVKAEINKLFNEKGTKSVIYLPDNQADIKKGESYGVAFSIQNDLRGDSNPKDFRWSVKASSIEKGCQLTLEKADSYIILNSDGVVPINPGERLSQPRIISIEVPEEAPLCIIQYDLTIYVENNVYDSNFFIIRIE